MNKEMLNELIQVLEKYGVSSEDIVKFIKKLDV